MRHCEGPLPSTLGASLFASDETDEGKADEGKVLVVDGKVLPFAGPSHPPSPSPSPLRCSSCTLPLPLTPLTDECGGCALHRYPPFDNVSEPS